MSSLETSWPALRESFHRPLLRQPLHDREREIAMSIITNPSVEKETPNVFPIRLTAFAGLAAAAVLFVNAQSEPD